MKYILALFLITLFFSCINQAVKTGNDEKNEVKDSLVQITNQEDTGSEDEYISNLKSFDYLINRRDSVTQTLCDTSYTNKSGSAIQLNNVSCPFDPYMLVVNNDKLQLVNRDFDKIYTLNTSMKIHTASWSPFNKSEIYLLVKKEFIKPDNEHTKYLPDTLFDLKLYSLNLDSMKMTQITTFYNHIVPLCRLDEDPPEFFGEQSFMKIDKANKLIYYDCVQPWNPDGDDYNLATYVCDLNNKTTTLSKLKKFKANHLTGKKVKYFKKGFYKPNELKSSKDFFVMDSLEDKPDVKIPLSVLYQEPIKLAEIEENYDIITFCICFIENNRIICSPAKEEDMAVFVGNIYLIDTQGHVLKTLIHNRVIGYNLTLSELGNGKYLISDTYYNRGRDELYLYDSSFNLLMQFNDLQHYEVKRRSVN